MTSVIEPGRVEYLNPPGLVKNPAFTNAVVAGGAVTTVYVGGQDAVDETGAIIGQGDIGAQAVQIFKNLRTALAAGGAGLEHVVKWNDYLVQGQPLQPAFEAFHREGGSPPNPPLITVLYVSGLAHPDFLIEIDALAIIPQ